MITFFTLGFIICTAVFISFVKHSKDRGSYEWIENLVQSYLIIGVVYILFAGIIFGAVTGELAKKWEYGWENKIVAMQDSKAYIVSRHNIEWSDRYYYMVDYGKGHYKQHWVNQARSDVYETNSKDYVILTYRKVINSTNWFMRDLEKFRDVLHDDEHRWEFYVPRGSVVQDFTIDMK